MKDRTDFGYEQVPVEDKARRVRGVFDSVAGKYDLMNDLMSAGVGSSRVDLQACKLEYSIVSPK